MAVFVEIFLTADDFDRCSDHARAMFEKRGGDYARRGSVKPDDSLVGKLCEVAVARYLRERGVGVGDPDFIVGDAHRAHGPDLRSGDGRWRVSVKGTQRRSIRKCFSWVVQTGDGHPDGYMLGDASRGGWLFLATYHPALPTHPANVAIRHRLPLPLNVDLLQPMDDPTRFPGKRAIYGDELGPSTLPRD